MQQITIHSEKFGVHHVLVDDEDFEKLSSRTWCIRKTGNKFYAETKERRVITILMHRFLMGVDSRSVYIDHKDGNGLNNQKGNLRTATHSDNLCNRGAIRNSLSKYKGVSWVSSRKKWRASIQKDKVNKSLGYFSSDIDAAIAYDKAAKEIHGEFAFLNFKQP